MEVIALCKAEPDRLSELLDCVIECPDEVVRMRASDALEKICRLQPSLVQPCLRTILGEMSRIDQPSVQWHVAQMLAELRLTSRQRRRAVHILEDNLKRSSDWIVLNCSPAAYADLAREHPELVGDLRAELHRFTNHHLKSVASRARKLSAEFGD